MEAQIKQNRNRNVTEQKSIHGLFLQDGTPKLRCFIIGNVENANAAGVLSSINTAFEKFGIMSLEKSLLGLNCDSAPVNASAYGGLGALIKENISWLELVHYFNHINEFALKDVFENSLV